MAQRDTKKLVGDPIPCRIGPSAGLAAVAVEKGNMAAYNASGYLTNAAATATLRPVGRFASDVDNSAGNAGDLDADVEQGTFAWTNGDSITIADIGKPCFVSAANTVTKGQGDGSRPFAGIIAGVDTDGVWVAMGLHVQGFASGTPQMQAVDATLASGTITINTGIYVAADSEVVPVLIGALTGSTNFGSLGELKASRVVGAPGTGEVVIQAYGADGALDADAAGDIRVLIFTPLAS